MPRQNRVTPFGAIVATPERGTIMGNRGVLHDDDGRIRRSWKLRRWLLCQLEFRGRHRPIMAPGRWTELFFLDEATGLAVGHRPCCECRRERYLAFRDAWTAGNHAGVRPETIRVASIDDCLHAERIGPDGIKLSFEANIDVLPDGVMVALDGPDGDAALIMGDKLLVWSPGGYRARLSRPSGIKTRVLTPQSTARAIQAGYVPGVHPTAGTC